MTRRVEQALRAADHGEAYHWPTIAAVLAGEVRRLRSLASPEGPDERQRAYDEGRWCGECRSGVVEDPPCCTRSEGLRETLALALPERQMDEQGRDLVVASPVALLDGLVPAVQSLLTAERERADRLAQVIEQAESPESIERAAREAFWTDDMGGHVKGRWTWETIPEVGRENFRALVRAVIRAALSP